MSTGHMTTPARAELRAVIRAESAKVLRTLLRCTAAVLLTYIACELLVMHAKDLV